MASSLPSQDRVAAALVLLSAIVIPVQGDAHAAALTLERVLETTHRHHPALKAARTEIPEAEAKILSARGGFDTRWKTKFFGSPVGNYPNSVFDTVVEQAVPWQGLSFFGGYRFGRGSFPAYEGKRETASGGEVRAGIKIPLWRDGAIDRRRANLRQAQLGRDAASARVRIQTLEALLAAARAYWGWVAAGRKLEVARQLLAIARQRQEAIARGVQLGQVAAIAQTENERLIVRRRSGVVSARRELEQAAIKLSLFLRGPDGSPRLATAAHLPRSLPEPDVRRAQTPAPAIAKALRRRPELAALRRELSQASVELGWARNQAAPRMDLSFSVAGDMGRGGPKLGKPDLYVGLLIDIPLQARKARGKAARARAKLERLEEKLRLAADKVGVQVRDALSALRAAAERVGLRRREAVLARRLEAGERKRFRLGASSLFLVNLREQGTAAARVKLIDSLAEYQKRRARYRTAIGCHPIGC